MEQCIVRLWDLYIAPLSLLAVAILWLAWPALAHGPGGKGSPAFEAYEKGQLPGAFKGRRNPLDQTEETIVAGQRIYQENCVMCHGANAEGKGHMATMLDKRPADLRQMFRHFPDVDDYYRWIILEGGERFDLPMPGFEGLLTDTQVWQVVTWMQSGFPGAGTEVKDIMHHDHSQPDETGGGHMMERPHQPMMPQHQRAIKSLSTDDIAELRRGGGWGLAKAAELNGVPGPAHLLDLKDEIPLSRDQVAAITDLYEDMRRRAVRHGQRLIELEEDLDRHFRNGTITESILRQKLTAIGRARADLRYVHLATHLETPKILSDRQTARYNRLRGYASDDPCAAPPEGHDAEMWRKHNGCE